MNQNPGMSVLAVLVGSIAGALLRYLSTLALGPTTSIGSSTLAVVVSLAGGAVLGLLLGSSVAAANDRGSRWPVVIMLAGAIATFGATSALTAMAETFLRDSLINIAATMVAAAFASGAIYYVRRT